MLLRGYSPRTRTVYLGHIRRFLEWSGERAKPPRPDPGADLRTYLVHLVEGKGLSRSSHSQVVSALRFMCETVWDQPAVALELPRPRKEHRLPKVLSPAEVARVIAQARGLKHRALLMLLYSAGLRVGEVVRLRPTDLDADRGLILVRQGKGRRDRYTLLARKAAEAASIYLSAFPTERWYSQEPALIATSRPAPLSGSSPMPPSQRACPNG
jgi:site-specific recombinase XerD